MSRTDAVIVVFAMLGVASLYPLYWQNHRGGGTAQIYAADKLVREVPLEKKQQIEISGALGKSILEVSDGKIRFIHSPCTSHVCVRQGWVHLSNHMLACLPNKVHVQITAENTLFDSLNF